MIKHLHLKNLLATLLTLAALFAGQQAFATITSPMSLTGNSALMNGQYYHVWKTEGFLGYYAQPRTQGSSYTFNGQNIGLQGGDVRITGTLNFTESNDFTDVTTGSTVTVEFYSTNFWFFNAEVKKLDGTSVSGCSYSASSDHSSITVTIPSGKTFGNIYLSYSVHPQMTESNTTISGIEATYIYQGSAIKPQPTVVYTNPNLSQTTLTLNTDYTLSYTNNNGPGIATVIITGAGEYAGTLTRTYTIRNIDLNDFNSLGNNTYEIANKDDLDHLALLVDVAANDCQGLTFRQTADITYSHGSSTTENNFTQIGGYFGGDKNFSGTYDGQNHTISGIRVYKSPSTNTNENKNVALFGRISGATIQNVILTDARITGYRYVGGLVGNKASGTVQNCLVVGSTITCGNTYGGALFGSNSGTLTANYYRNCTVNNTTNATNVGVGSSSSSSDMAGARSMHPLTIQNANITATGESVAYQGTTYYASNTQITLGYNNLPAGYTLTYTLNGNTLSGNTFTMPANDNATVSATLTPITYNITYDLDGGSVATANPTTYNVTTPTFTLNNPTKAGYTFTGWTGSNGTTPQTEVTIVQGSMGNLNYTAHWSLDTYNITYDLDGGSVATANPITYNVTTPTFTLNNPTKAGYTFDGWTGSNGTTPQTSVTIAQGSTGDRDYTAHWTLYVCTLTLGANITASGTVAFTLDGIDYYAPGTEITLAYSGTIPEGQYLVFEVNGTPIANNGNTFAILAINTTVSVAFCDWPGTGTENDPYIISTTAELDMLAQRVNHTNPENYRGKYFKLGADIAYDPTNLTIDNDGNGINESNYTTIGYYQLNSYFCGIFDGDGHTISGIRSNYGLFDTNNDYSDFSVGTVKNVTLADAVISSDDIVAGIVCFNAGGHIENCHVINTVINYERYGGSDNCVGGIAGWNTSSSSIVNCHVINTVINVGFHRENCSAGGIAGENDGTIENCLVLDTDIIDTEGNGFICGGAIVGSNPGNLTSNYYHGCTVIAENTTYTSNIGWCYLHYDIPTYSDITENDGAVQVFSLSIGGNVTATPDPVVTYDGTDYYFAGTGITLSTNIGYAITSATLTYGGNDFPIEPVDGVYSFTMPAEDATVSAELMTAMTWTDLKAALEAGGTRTVTLTNNVTRNVIEGINVQGTVTLDLNGYTIDGNSPDYYNPILGVNNGVSLTITDSGTGGNLCKAGPNATVYVSEGGSFTLASGTINAQAYGVNVYKGSFTMTGGTITGSNNRGVFLHESATFTMSGGTITGNKTGVEFNYNPIESNGPTFTVSGNVNITGNTTKDVNMYYKGSSFIPIHIGGTLASTARIGINIPDYAANAITGDVVKVFTSGLSGYGTKQNFVLNGRDGHAIVTTADGELAIAEASIFTKDIAGYGNSDGGYYLIASPVGTVSPENVGNMTSNEFDLYRFNQSAALEWENWVQEGEHLHFDLEVGRGYLYANRENVTLSFTGTPIEGDTYEVTLAKDNNADWAGWNLVGNPFTETAYFEGNHSFYTMNADGSDLVPSSSASIEAMEGVFVIAETDGETLTFTTTEPNQVKKQIVLNLSGPSIHRGTSSVADSGTATIDRAIVRFGQSDLLPKFMLNPNNTKMYITKEGTDYAVTRCSNNGSVPVSFEPSEDGTYFINVDIENVAVRYLHLIDHEEGLDIDLLREPRYKFDAKTTESPNRFELVFKTGSSQYKEVFLKGGDSDDFAFISNGKIIVNGEGTLQVIDMTGRIIVSRSGEVSGNVSTRGLKPGVYVLRLMNGDDVKTQKIVIQ
jgi:uncharacterized repeat protein (TIGR02543 family)